MWLLEYIFEGWGKQVAIARTRPRGREGETLPLSIFHGHQHHHSLNKASHWAGLR